MKVRTILVCAPYSIKYGTSLGASIFKVNIKYLWSILISSPNGTAHFLVLLVVEGAADKVPQMKSICSKNVSF
jgi:hypothetical protein